MTLEEEIKKALSEYQNVFVETDKMDYFTTVSIDDPAYPSKRIGMKGLFRNVDVSTAASMVKDRFEEYFKTRPEL